jgi:DUF4097 and DUF4098 domain-containing protein YvlB
MRRRSLAGPLILMLIGGFFLWHNLRPDFPFWDTFSRYWPFLLIAWGLARLAEVMIWRPQRRASGFSGGEVALIVLISIAGMGMFQAHRFGMRFNPRGFYMFGEQFDYTVSARRDASGIRRIVFENPRGNIRVTGGDSSEIAVQGRKTIRASGQSEADRTDQNTQVEIVPQGDRMLIRTNQDRAGRNQRVSHDLEVSVPAGVVVEARNQSGDFDISGIGGDVEIASDRADVRLSRIGGNTRLDVGRSGVIRAVDVKGTLSLQGRGSDVELENIAGQVTVNGSYSGTLDFKNLAKPLHFESRNTDLRVEAIPGRISMDLGELTARNVVGPIRLTTKSRDIKFEEFTQALELETERGDIELVPGKLPMAKIDARSRTGRIDLVIPDKATFDLEATAEHGDAVNDFGPPIRRETEGRSATLKGKVGNGPAVHLTADRGTVAVRKAGMAPSALTPPAPPAPPKAPAPPKPPKSLADTEMKL